MFAGILITDGGPHPAEKWAVFVAEKIVPLGGVTVGDRPIQAQKLQLAVAEAVADDFARAQSEEKAKLEADPSHFLTEHDTDQYVGKMMDDIVKCAVGTPWEGHFSSNAVRNEVSAVFSQHIRDALHIERMWHADRNPDIEEGKAYKAKFGQA